MHNGMDRAGSRLFLVYLLGLVALLGGLALAKGALYVDRHEGDTLHLIEIVLRMAGGEWPHLDFVTPLGALSFLPIVGFVQLGFGVGTSILLAQVAIALAFVPMVWWVGRSRLSRGAAYAVGGLVMVLALALIHGEATASLSVSMHYNRWAWAFAFIAVLVALLEPKQAHNQTFDGVIIGVAFGFFAMGKVTFAVALAPAVILALVLRKQWAVLAVGLSVVLLMALALTFLAGADIWQRYVLDILIVTSTDIRQRPGVDLATLLTAPQYVLGIAVLVLSIVVLRRGVEPRLGLVLIFLGPGLIYVTYQNYGNDPKWLALLAVLLISIARTPQVIALAVIATTLIAPSFLNMAVSPARHFAANTASYTALFEDTPYAEVHGDVHTKTERVNRILIREPMIFETPDLTYLNARAEHLPPPAFQGEVLASCAQELGLIGAIKATARDLDSVLPADSTVFMADTFDNLWMFGALAPTLGAAPWYYGALSGYDAAQYFLIPRCPATPGTFRSILKDVEARGETLEEIRRTELYVLFKTP